MISIEAKLKERIKELTCLYEVTSIIVNSDYDQLGPSLEAIAYCLKKAWQFGDDAQVVIKSNGYYVETDGNNEKLVFIKSDIKVFNRVDDFIEVGYPSGNIQNPIF